ncbi:hypothetical protein D7294_04840 [Streptomyces hoynatensis]|uniref:Uncharacterized protein n=1 Tax=Streptomyces hoynatensis TaxID=1141874 RepID=A0A3A9ZC86_9ACTN|nr:hypothetical protein D7294_04840 [Streptomyces hoynatensis]
MPPIGLSAGSRHLPDADHLLHRLAAALALPGGTLGCTHPVRAPGPILALSLSLPGPAETGAAYDRLAGGLAAELGLATAWQDARTGPPEHHEGAAAGAAAAALRSGRAVLFPGWSQTTGTLTVGELLDRTAITRTVALGGLVPEPTALLDTRAHLRPEWEEDDLLLRLMPARGGTYVPFDIPDTHPCCGGRH